MEIKVNATSIETCLWHIESYLIKQYGADQAARDMEPLKWYVNTGRASTAYIRALMAAKPYMVARRLHKGNERSESYHCVISMTREVVHELDYLD